MATSELRNGIAKFDPKKIDPEVMRRFVEEQAGGFPLDGTPRDASAPTLGVALYLHFKKAVPEDDDMLECDDCKGLAPDTTDVCPYCGSEGGPPGDAAPAAEPALANAAPATHSEPSAPAKTPGAKKKKKKGAKASAQAAPTSDGGEAKGKESTIMGEVVQTNGKSSKNGLTAIKGGGAPLESTKATEKTLDRLVSEAKSLLGTSAGNYLSAATRVKEIRDKRLWQLRTDEGGKSKYASFDAFVHHEFGFTPQYASLLAKHAEEFTDEEAGKLGRSKMTLILQAPPAERARLKEEAVSKKKTKRALAKDVKEARKKANYTGDTAAQKAAAQSAKNKKPKAPKATAVLLDGKKTIKMYQRPPSIRNIKLEDLKRAKLIKDRPFTIIELANQGRILVEVKKDAKGELLLSYEFQRPE